MTLQTALKFHRISDFVSFSTRKEAKNYIESLNKDIYYLSHNESERPDYNVVKIPYESLYLISRTRYFFGSTKEKDFLLMW